MAKKISDHNHLEPHELRPEPRPTVTPTGGHHRVIGRRTHQWTEEEVRGVNMWPEHIQDPYPEDNVRAIGLTDADIANAPPKQAVSSGSSAKDAASPPGRAFHKKVSSIGTHDRR